jgi:hypothetical protein
MPAPIVMEILFVEALCKHKKIAMKSGKRL